MSINPIPIYKDIVQDNKPTLDFINYLVGIQDKLNETLSRKVKTITSDYTVSVYDEIIIIDDSSGATINITLPSASSCYSNETSKVFIFYRSDSSAGVVNINGVSIAGGEGRQYFTDGTNWYYF